MTDHIRSHPVFVVLHAAAAGHEPSAADLDAVAALAGDDMPADVLRQRTAEAAATAAELRRAGARRAARNHATDRARYLIGKLPAAPGGAGLADGVDDPAALADLVGRPGHRHPSI